MPTSTHWLSPDSKGSSMPRPTETPSAWEAPLLAASITPGPPPVITAYPARTSLRPSSSAAANIGSTGLVPPEANHADRRAELDQHPEPFDELGLVPQPPPRVGVHPVGRAPAVQQP